MNIINRYLDKNIYIEDIKVGDIVKVLGFSKDHEKKRIVLGSKWVVVNVPNGRCTLDGTCDKRSCVSGLINFSLKPEGSESSKVIYSCNLILGNSLGIPYKTRYLLPEDYVHTELGF
jgi:hypothetical protein